MSTAEVQPTCLSLEQALIEREIRGFLAEQCGNTFSVVLPDGTRDVLGLWIVQTEGARC